MVVAHVFWLPFSPQEPAQGVPLCPDTHYLLSVQKSPPLVCKVMNAHLLFLLGPLFTKVAPMSHRTGISVPGLTKPAMVI